jgi:hypothetical protein
MQTIVELVDERGLVYYETGQLLKAGRRAVYAALADN